ncbi:hypothetical protein QOT17_009185 [Balamuthia mandrillaris]
MLFPRWSSLAFILCVLSVCLQVQPLDVPSVEDSITVFEGVKSQLRFVNTFSPTVFAFPKDKHGRVVEAYWAALSLLQFRELRCSALLPTFSFFHIFRLEGVLGNCSEEGQHVTDLLVPAKWQFDASEENLLRFSLPGLGDAASLFVGTFEYVPEAKNVTSRNKAGTERRMRVEGDSLKISFDVYNYTSQTVTDLNEASQLADSFFQMRFKLKTKQAFQLELSHAIVPVVLSQNPVLTFPVSISPSDTSEHQLTYFIDVLNDLFRVRVSQALFSVTEPPVGSTVVAEEAEWGFEPVNGDMVWNASNTEATDHAFVFELHFSGGERLSYDPDISILLNNEHESENGKAESDEDAVVIAVSIVVPVVVVASVAFVAVVAWLRHSRKARRVSRLSTVISKHVDA